MEEVIKEGRGGVKRERGRKKRDGKYESETDRHGLQNEIVMRIAEGTSRIREGKTGGNNPI